MIIAFTGCSGSGKTEMIHNIKGWSFLKDKKVVVKEEDSFFLIKLAKSIMGDNSFSEYKNKKMFPDNNKRSMGMFGTITDIFYPLVVYFECLVDYLLYEYFLLDTVLLKDRYIYDYLVTFESNLNINNPLLKFFYLNFPKPYLIFYLDIDVDTAIYRNKNTEKGKITNQKMFHQKVLSSYRDIASSKNLISIDNNDDQSGSVQQVKYHIQNKHKLSQIKRVVITGLDGSGKTTVVNMLSDYLMKLGISNKVAHFYHDNILFKFLKLIRYYDAEESEEEMYQKRRNHNIRAKAQGRPFVWGLLHYLDSYIQLAFTNLFHCNKLIIYDRYFYDFLVSFEFLRVPGRRLFAMLIMPVRNRFLLVCSPEIMYKRKPETPLEFAKEHYKSYIKIAKQYKLKKINSEYNSPDEVLVKLLESIPL